MFDNHQTSKMHQTVNMRITSIISLILPRPCQVMQRNANCLEAVRRAEGGDQDISIMLYISTLSFFGVPSDVHSDSTFQVVSGIPKSEVLLRASRLLVIFFRVDIG